MHVVNPAGCQSVTPGGDVVLTQAAQNVGAAINVTVPEVVEIPRNNQTLAPKEPTGTVVVVSASVDLDVGATSTNGLMTAQLLVDGVVQAAKAVLNDTAIGVRSVVSATWLITGLKPGAHTFQLQALKANATGTGTARAANTSLVVEQLDPSMGA